MRPPRKTSAPSQPGGSTLRGPASRSYFARCQPGLLLLVLLVGPAAVAQRNPGPEEPKWLRLQLTRLTGGLRAEGEYDVTTYGGGGDPVTYSTLFIGPELGLDAIGSIYHPNLCTMSLSSQGAFGETWQTVKTSTSTSTSEQMNWLGNVRFNADFLNPKPLRATVFAEMSHAFQDLDTFSQIASDRYGLGARTTYQGGPWQVDGAFGHNQETSTDIIGSGVLSETTSDTASFNALHTRPNASTAFGYIYGHYDYLGTGGQNTLTENQSISATDHEQFGSRNQFGLTSRASYLLQDSSIGEGNNQLLGGVDLTAAHPNNLNSSYSFTGSRYQSDDLISSDLNAIATVSHQLYESLQSALTLNGLKSEFSDGGGNGFLNTVGLTWGEVYTKRLGENHSFQINNALSFNLNNQQGISTVENEAHTFSTAPGNPLPDAFFLNQLYAVTSTIQVWDTTQTQLYQEGVAYNVIVNGAQTLIQRIPGVGINGIPAGATVLVDYQVVPLTTGEYTSIGENGRVRLNLWKNLWGIYAGYAANRANGSQAAAATVDFTRVTLGTDINWRWFNAGAEAEYYDSDVSITETLGFFQSAAFRFKESGSLGVNLSERWLRFVNNDQDQQQYRLNIFYNRPISGNWRVDLQTGVYYTSSRTQSEEDETLAVFRPALLYNYGRTTISVFYRMDYTMTGNTEYQWQNTLNFVATRQF